MSINNPFAATFGLKVDPDNKQDRRSSVVIRRKMTPEEIQLYGNVGEQYKKPKAKAVITDGKDDMSMKKIDKERLEEICNENGFNEKAYKIAADEFGVTPHSVECFVSKKKMNKQKDKQEVHKDKVTQIQNEDKVVKQPPESEPVKTEILQNEDDILNKIRDIINENRLMKEQTERIKKALYGLLVSLE